MSEDEHQYEAPENEEEEILDALPDGVQPFVDSDELPENYEEENEDQEELERVESLEEEGEEQFEEQEMDAEEQPFVENRIPKGILEAVEPESEPLAVKPTRDKQQLEKTKTKKKKGRKQLLAFKRSPSKKTIRNIILVLLFSSLFNYLIMGITMHFSPNTINKAANGILLLPGNFIAEMMELWLIIVAGFFILYPLFPYISKAYLFLHKLVKLKRFQYSIVTTDEHHLSFKEALGRFMIPYLFSFVLGYWFSTWFFIPSLNIPPQNYHAVATLVYFLFSLILMPVVIFLISPLWLLDDAGIIAMKKRKEGERSIPDIEGPSVFFVNIYTGSAYTLALVTIGDFFITVFSAGFQIDIFLSFLFIIFILMPNTILLIVYMYDLFFKKAKRKLLKIVPTKLVDKMPKTVVDITAFDPFFIPEGLELAEGQEATVDMLKEPLDFDIETEEP